MARVVVGYEGGRPVFKDEGPARGRVGSGDSDVLAKLGTSSLPDRLAPTHFGAGDGYGQIERRQATAAQRAAWSTEREGKPRSPGTNGDPFAASRARGAARSGFVPGATKPYLEKRVTASPSPPEEVPVPAIVASEPTSNNADSIPERPDPDVVTPCEDCVHAPVCAIRPTLVFREIIGFTALHFGVRVAAISIECDYFLERPAESVAAELREAVERLEASKAAVDALESVTAPVAPDDAAKAPVAAGRPGGGGTAKLPRDQAEREARILEAVRATPTTTKAGVLLDVSGKRVQQLIQEMRREGRLPADVDELMRKRAGGRPGWAQA